MDTIQIHRADQEDFLSLHEKVMSRLVAFGSLSPTKQLTSSQEGTQTKSDPFEKRRRETLPSPKPISNPGAAVNPSTSLPPRKPPLGRATPEGKPRNKKLPSKAIPVERGLPTLLVRPPRGKDQPGLGEDQTRRVTVTWTDQEVYRIACIGDGSCFFHAYLKGFYDEYQNNNSYAYRSDLVRRFRNELAVLLTEEDPDYPGYVYYQTIANGSLAELAQHQTLSESSLGMSVDYSIFGVVELLASNDDIGDEMYSFVSEIIGIGCYVVRGTNFNVYPQISVGIERPSVVIMGNGVHYELIAVKHDNGFQTLFEPGDPFLVSLANFKNK